MIRTAKLTIASCRLLQRSLALLSAAIVGGAVLVAAIAQSQYGTSGAAAAFLAAGACWIGAASALVVVSLARGPGVAYATLLATGIRILPPLTLALFYGLRGGALANSGGAWWLVVLYGWTLLVETLLTLRLVRPNDAQQEAA